MRNEYQVTAPTATAIRMSPERRTQLQGAILGSGLPLLLASVSYWTPGWGVMIVLGALGAFVGAIVGWRSAQRSVSTLTPIRTALRFGVVGATAGALLVAAIYFVGVTLAIGALAGLVMFLATVVFGVVIGSFLSIPVALLSVFLLRRFGATGRRATALAAILLAAILLIGGAAVIDFPQNGSWRLYPDHDPQGQPATWKTPA